MDRRKEQRFQVYSAARMILVDHPEREMECLLTDISARGLRLIADDNLPSDSIIVVEAENHLVLCDIRNSQARGQRFALGAEKIHTMSKMDIAPDATMADKTQALIEDYQGRIRNGLSMTPEPDLSPEAPHDLPKLNIDEVDAMVAAGAPQPMAALPPPIRLMHAPRPVHQPDPVPSPVEIRRPEQVAQSEPVFQREEIAQPEPQPEPMTQAESMTQPESISKLEPMMPEPKAPSARDASASPEPIAPSMETHQPQSAPPSGTSPRLHRP